MDPASQPWFRESQDLQPFSLFTMLTSDGRPFHSVACFPWTDRSLDTLWNGQVQNTELEPKWKEVAKKWMGTVAVGGTGRLCIFPNLATAKPINVTLSQDESDLEIQNVAWAINSDEPLKPLIVFTTTSVIVIYDVTIRLIVGKLRGHGGPITSLAVHQSLPNLFCTTSRDFTARVYDLSLFPVQKPNNPHWLPNRTPSFAGPAHGLHMYEPEGEGIGQCVAVMVGGRSGGHRGAVLCCAFHPSQPLIATGGMDRAVKVWRIPRSVFTRQERPRLAREDKPLFSTDLIHKARVLSISWLADDILTSCSAPALMRRKPEDVDSMYWENGTVAVWQWLGFNRFFPPGMTPQKVMRGTASDWRNSESFKVFSAYHLPFTANRFHVYRSLTHDPLLLVPVGKIIRIFNIAQFGPREPPKFPLDDIDLSEKLANQRLDDESHSKATSIAGEGAAEEQVDTREKDYAEDADDVSAEDSEDGTGIRRSTVPSFTYPPPAPLATLFDSVEGWDVVAELPQGGGPPEMPDITSCAMGFEGLGIVAIGEKGTLYVWRLKK